MISNVVLLFHNRLHSEWEVKSTSSLLRKNINHSCNVKLCPRPLGDPCPLSSALENPMGILQPYGKEESITGPMKVLDAMWERNESHLSGVWRSKQLGSNEGCHKKSQRAVPRTKKQANYRIGANVWRNRQARENFLNHQNCPELPEEAFIAAKMRVTDIQRSQERQRTMCIMASTVLSKEVQPAITMEPQQSTLILLFLCNPLCQHLADTFQKSDLLK